MLALLRISWPGVVAVVIALHATPSRVLSDGYPHYPAWFYALLSAGWASVIGLYAGLVRLHLVAGEPPDTSSGPPRQPLQLLAGDIPPDMPRTPTQRSAA